MDAVTLKAHMTEVAEVCFQKYEKEEKDKRHAAYTALNSVTNALTLRLDTLEKSLDGYRDECAKSNATIFQSVDRLVSFMEGDRLSVGFVKAQRELQAKIIERLDEIEEHQTNSRQHHTVHMSTAQRVDALEATVGKMQEQTKLDAAVLKAYKRFMTWLVAVVNGVWVVGTTIYQVFF